MKTFLDHFMILSAKYAYIIILILALGFYFKLQKTKRLQMALLGIIALPVMFIVLKIAGHFYYDPRPFVVGHFIPLIPHAADNGFPSDHTILSAAIAAIFFPYNKKWSLCLWLLTLLVGFSRVYVGVHHPIDIVTSVLIGGIVTSLVYIFIIPKIVNTPWFTNFGIQKTSRNDKN